MVNKNDECRLYDRSEEKENDNRRKREAEEGENAEDETSNRYLSNEVDNIGNSKALVHTNVESQEQAIKLVSHTVFQSV